MTTALATTEVSLRGKLGEGKVALIDAADAELVSARRWYLSRQGYAVTPDGIIMHRLIAGTKRPAVTDHINGVRLDNRRANLRCVTNQQNAQNTSQRSHSRQPYKGIRRTSSGKWAARITYSGRVFCLGSFENPLRAAMEYDRWANDLFGRFAKPNRAFYVELRRAA